MPGALRQPRAAGAGQAGQLQCAQLQPRGAGTGACKSCTIQQVSTMCVQRVRVHLLRWMLSATTAVIANLLRHHSERNQNRMVLGGRQSSRPTATKSEISVHQYSNSYRLLNSCTNECFPFTGLLRPPPTYSRDEVECSPPNSEWRKESDQHQRHKEKAYFCWFCWFLIFCNLGFAWIPCQRILTDLAGGPLLWL